MQFLEVMGRRSLEVYLAAEITEEFVMYPGKRRGGGIWEVVLSGLGRLGVGGRSLSAFNCDRAHKAAEITLYTQ